MYIFTNVFFGHRISRKLADQSRHVQQQVLQFADIESYGPAVHGELGPRFDPSCHGLLKERKFVALVGFLLADMLAECRKIDRQGVEKTIGACLAAPNSKQTS
jgi:hypothetical protein